MEFKEHIHALECLRFLNNNPSFAWAAFRTPSLVTLYERCGEKIENNPHVLAKLVRKEMNESFVGYSTFDDNETPEKQKWRIGFTIDC